MPDVVQSALKYRIRLDAELTRVDDFLRFAAHLQGAAERAPGTRARATDGPAATTAPAAASPRRPDGGRSIFDGLTLAVPAEQRTA